MELHESKKVLQSYVYNNTIKRSWFISTCIRPCSGDLGGYFYETLGWIMDENNQRTDFVIETGSTSLSGAIQEHNRMVLELLERTS